MNGIARQGTRWIGREVRRSLRLALIAGAVAVAAIGSGWAVGPAFHAGIDRPVLYRGHLYASGQIELVPVGSGGLLSLRLDGQAAAMIFKHSLGRYRSGEVPEFYFRRVGEALELADIRWSGTDPRGRVEVLLVVRAQIGRAPG
jgi:hypothetical protein